MSRRLIVYARRPLPGRAKTRLAADIGAEQAAGAYARMLFHYLLTLIEAQLERVSLHISTASPADVPFFATAFPEFGCHAQREGDLGRRLAGTFEEAFADGARSVVVTASDSPALCPALVRAAFQALEDAPAVIGPCADGGYYLLGMNAPGAPLFTDVDWGTDRVLQQTEALATAAGLEMVRLPLLIDVDTGEDLAVWRGTDRRDR